MSSDTTVMKLHSDATELGSQLQGRGEGGGAWHGVGGA